MPKHLCCGLAASAIFLASGAQAVAPFGATPQEKAMCDSTIGELRERAAALTGTKPDMFHLHHYCDCLRFRQRAMTSMRNRNDYRYNLQEAVGGCDYVLNHTGKDHGLRAMVHVDKGRALKLLGDSTAAARNFVQAVQLEPRIPEPHYELALLLRDRGDKAGALEAATLGLKYNAGIKPLDRLYFELGGKQPLPKPEAATPAQSTPVENPAATPATALRALSASGATAPAATAPAAVPAAGKDTLVTGSTSRQSGTAVVNGTRGRVIGN